MAIEPSSLNERHPQPNELIPTPDQTKTNPTVPSTSCPASTDGAADGTNCSTTRTTTRTPPTVSAPASTEATAELQNSTPPPGRTVDGLMEAPDRSDAVEPRASDHSRPGPAFGCREGVFQATLSGEYQPEINISGPDASAHYSPDGDSDCESNRLATGAAERAAPIIAMQWNVCGLSTRHAELEMLLKKHRPTVIALQEVQTDRKSVV